MAAMQTLPVNGSAEFQQAVNLQAFNMMVKQEVVDPNYVAASPSAPNRDIPQQVKKTATRRKSKGESGSTPAVKAKKVKKELMEPVPADGIQTQIGDHMPVQKKKRDRFKGTTEEEVLTRVLPDHIREDLDILIVGINPGLTAAYIQHHYAGPGNHFWKCLYLSGIIPQPMNAMQDAELLNYGIGFTNIVARTTRGSADLTRKEIAEGGEILKEKMLKYLPKIALFNGKGIYEVFCGSKNFHFGLQPEPFPGCPNTCIFVNPSSSARCTQLPRAVDKVPFYEALKRVRDHIRAHGSLDGLDRSTVTFPDFKLVTAPQKNKVKEEPQDPNGNAPQSQQPTPSAPTQTTKKPRKPRASKKKEVAAPSPQQQQSTPPATTVSHLPATSSQQPFLASNNLHPQSVQSHLQQQSMTNFNPIQSSNPNTTGQDLQSRQAQLKVSTPSRVGDLMIKQEVTNPGSTDRDLEQVLRQNFGMSNDFMNIAHNTSTSTVPLRPAFLPQNMVLPTNSSQAPVKQERPDWSGYGVMPVTSATTPVSTYPQYPSFWPYLGCATSNAFITNPYQSIPNPHMSHPQAAAATAVLNSSAATAQANSSAPVAATYNSPQEASSPAMSSQSNLTQASLDSLPKADSASTVANWLQNIPNMSAAQ